MNHRSIDQSHPPPEGCQVERRVPSVIHRVHVCSSLVHEVFRHPGHAAPTCDEITREAKHTHFGRSDSR